MKTFWDIAIDKYDTQPNVVTATLRCDPRFSIKKVGAEIVVESPGGGEIPPFDSLSGAMGWCERREALI